MPFVFAPQPEELIIVIFIPWSGKTVEQNHRL